MSSELPKKHKFTDVHGVAKCERCGLASSEDIPSNCSGADFVTYAAAVKFNCRPCDVTDEMRTQITQATNSFMSQAAQAAGFMSQAAQAMPQVLRCVKSLNDSVVEAELIALLAPNGIRFVFVESEATKKKALSFEDCEHSKRAVYCGSVAELKGKTATVWPNGLAKFDNSALLGHGQHQFSLEDFEDITL